MNKFLILAVFFIVFLLMGILIEEIINIFLGKEYILNPDFSVDFISGVTSIAFFIYMSNYFDKREDIYEMKYDKSMFISFIYTIFLYFALIYFKNKCFI